MAMSWWVEGEAMLYAHAHQVFGPGLMNADAH
jgi:hypothetical protein